MLAIKTLEIIEKPIRRILSEISTFETLHHLNIISFFQVLKTPKQAHIVTELAPGGNRLDLIMEDGPLQEEEAQNILSKIASAINRCHNLDIVHGDVKPQHYARCRQKNEAD